MQIVFTPNLSYTKQKNQAQNNLMSATLTAPQIKMDGLPKFSYGIINFGNALVPSRSFQDAQSYLIRRMNELRTNKNEWIHLSKFDLNKLNGIQEGIKVFQGLSMKEIAFLSDNLKSILTYRGCSNHCGHCMVDAQSHVRLPKNANEINQMAMEDFYSLTQGIKQLSKRLGFNPVEATTNNPIYTFRDSDCIEIEMLDNAQRVYDFRHANNLMYDATGLQGRFDTSGWKPDNVKHQQRAEDIVTYFMDSDNMDKVDQVNISVNPFHILNEISINAKNAGDDVKAKDKRNNYTDRMANAILTFTPLIHNPKFGFVVRAKDKNAAPWYSYKGLESLVDEILAKVRHKYIEDYTSNKRIYIFEPRDIADNLECLKSKLMPTIQPITGVGRAVNLLGKDSESVKIVKKNTSERFAKLQESLKTSPKMEKFIDSNGRVYLACGFDDIPTEIQLNFQNKDKMTPKLSGLVDYTVTKKRIDEEY